MYFLYLTVLASSFLWLFCRFTKNNTYFLIISWLIFFVALGTYGYFTDDYEPYVDIVLEAYVDPFAYLHIESFWIWLANYVHGNVDLFRFISFLLIATLLLLIVKTARVNIRYFFVYYTIMCLSTHLCWIRQPLAMCFCLLGMLLLCDKRLLVGLSCIVLSCFIHKSAIMFALMVPMCILPVDKKSVWIYLCSIPVLYIIFFIVINSSSTVSSLLYLQKYAQQEGEYEERNIIFQILSLFFTLSQFFFLIYTICRFNKNADKQVSFLVRYLLGLLFVSFFFFILPLDTNVIYKRLLAFGMFILVVIWSKCLCVNFLKYSYIYLFLIISLYSTMGEVMKIGNNYTRIERLLRMP